MKNLKKTILFTLLVFAINTSFAQAKLGHISTDLLLTIMPETIALNNELEELSKAFEADLKLENDKLEAKLRKYDSEAATQTNETNKERSLEVQQDQQKLYQSSKIAQEEITKKRDEKLKPILEKAKKAIVEVANANGYTYIIEAATLVVANGTDIMPLVKTKLGIK
jgi:outer membrane protein